jgi:hypothetical protein
MSKAEKRPDDRPLTFKLAYWWGFIFALVYLLYGAVNLVLGFLDRQYGDLSTPFFFLLIGIILIVVAYAFRGRKMWGWYGEIAVNGLIIVAALFGFRHYSNLVLLIVAAVALVLLFAGETKRYVLEAR